ncbi:inhibitor of nuclear factor kappa-B kinase subunit beta-like isoform X1 [Cataglyphis hispanica]|uniref:inhibitor of nuclear factor kappa-B kinase subunit beta-like isoform X1 n=1 Tax=Cataglyphis hispanica TaxID=1086592 RepID=UPI0021801F65|nr:inhibitor of nuclear factor kappa-B kinase subunit beta-like isoform X1 [Cataglyphis hispanica]
MTSNIVSSDNWKLKCILGTGGFGIVELWAHVQNGEKLAIKRCKWNYSQLTPVQRKRWANEVDIMRRLRHPNIVKTGCIPFKLRNTEENLPVLCMEYCKKGDLRKILNQSKNCCGIVEIEAIKIMTEVLSAVEYLHSQNITHRDLKPENIVLQEENNVLSYKLIDLGYAKELGEMSTSASLVGTLNYVAPELLWKEKYSSSVDYWSLGILFYELVTGTRPFLPTMQHTMEWMKHIQNKSYDDIYACEMEGKVIFGKDIQNPTYLSSCLRNKMVQWFRVVLQWDPHKRGRIIDESGTSHLVVFTMLQHALSNKIIYIFCVPFYKIYTYEIDNDTTIKDLQLLIEKDTNIEVKHQTLTNYSGVRLTESTVSVISQTNDHIFFLFRNGYCLIEDVPRPNIPVAVEKMIIQSKNELNYEVLTDYYRNAIYFATKEVNLFQLYVFALSINIDLLHQKIDVFNTNMEMTLENTKALIDKVHIIRFKYMNLGEDAIDRKKAQTYFNKVDKLISAADQIKMQFMSLKKDNDKLRNKAQSIDCMRDLSKLYDKMCNIYLEFKKESPHKIATPLDMVKLMFSFLTTREALLHDKNIIDIIRQIDKLNDGLLKLQKIFNSVTVMTKLYWKEYQLIAQSDVSPQSNNQSLNISTTELDKVIQPEDNIIYDNLVIRSRLDKLMAEMQKKYNKIVNLEL